MSLTPEAKQKLIDNYRSLLEQHGEGPGVAHYKTIESQFMRFKQLVNIGDLSGASVLEVGCGIGDFYAYLQEKVGNITYRGVDIVPEIVESAKRKHPDIQFECRDILSDPISEDFDYVLISGVFNNAIPDSVGFMRALLEASFARSKKALGFNFISTYVNYTEPDFAYFDPTELFKWCLDNLSRKVSMFHHYERTDVCVFVYR